MSSHFYFYLKQTSQLVKTNNFTFSNNFQFNLQDWNRQQQIALLTLFCSFFYNDAS